MGKLIKMEITALAEQLLKKLELKYNNKHEAAMKAYNKKIAVFEKQKYAVTEETKKFLADKGWIPNYSLGLRRIDQIEIPKKPFHMELSEIVNRIIIKQIDVQDITKLQILVEADVAKSMAK